jgi:hypothetical protein
MSPMTVKSYRSPSAGASEVVQLEAVQFEVVPFGVVPPTVAERSFEGELSFEEELLPPVAAVTTPGDIVIRATNIAVVAAMLAVFIVAVRLQLAVRS